MVSGDQTTRQSEQDNNDQQNLQVLADASQENAHHHDQAVRATLEISPREKTMMIEGQSLLEVGFITYLIHLQTCLPYC